MVQATIQTTVTGIQTRPVNSTAPTTNQALGWNGSAWTPMGPYLALTGGTMTGAINTTGNIQTTGGVVQSPGNVGTFLNGAGVNVESGKANVSYQTTSFSNVFSGPTNVMGGLGPNMTMTPQITGRILVIFRAIAWVTNSSYTFDYSVNFGTGTPPGLNAAAVGTTMAINVQVTGFTTGNTFTLMTMHPTAFTVGTTYWFDTLNWTNAGGGGSYNYINFYASEV